MDCRILWQSFVTEQRLECYNSWAGTELATVLPWPLHCCDREPPAPDGNYCILVEICWRYWNKLSIILESGESPVCSHGQCSAMWTPCFMSFQQMDERLSQSQTRWLLLGWLCRHPDTHAWGHMCRCVCIRRCEESRGWWESCTERPFQDTPIPLEQPEQRSDQLHAGAWGPQSVWALAVLRFFRSGLWPPQSFSSAYCTCENKQTWCWQLGNPSSPQKCVNGSLRTRQGKGRKEGSKAMNHYLNTGPWGGINCRKGFRSHASFLETKVLKADFSNGMHGLLWTSWLLPLILAAINILITASWDCWSYVMIQQLIEYSSFQSTTMMGEYAGSYSH